jgi:hypothetical protein
MKDLREKVKEDRGLIKKIELAIPGFRGYRKREDLRIADSLLRKQLADDLKGLGTEIEGCRRDIIRNKEIDVLEDVARIVNNIQLTENKIRHAEQGYTGISADYRIKEEELDNMYEWDLSLLDNIVKIRESIDSLRNAVFNNNSYEMKTCLRDAETIIQRFNSLFDTRREKIAGLGVEK